MTADNHGQSGDAGWLTLTEAAARSGHSREALRQRVRRGKLRSQKGNDGVLRVHAAELADLPPPEDSSEDNGASLDDRQDAVEAVLRSTMDDLRATVDNLRTDLERTRTALDKAQADRLDDHGRAERAEAQAAAEAARAETAERRLAAAEAALAEARTPWAVRLVRAIRGG